jgi:halocyanin-like protein
VNVDDQGGQVTMKTQPARHNPHPLETMGGPVELPRIWAFQADDRAPSIPRPTLRTTEGEDMEVTLDNTDGGRPHTIHFHGVTKKWKDDGVIPESGQHEMDVANLAPAERYTLEFEADADPGIYLMHCHKVNHVMNGNFYPGEMFAPIVYRDAMDTDIFAQLMAYAGYEVRAGISQQRRGSRTTTPMRNRTRTNLTESRAPHRHRVAGATPTPSRGRHTGTESQFTDIMTHDTPRRTQCDRRTVLKAGFAAAFAVAVGAKPAVAAGNAEASLEDWLGNVSNFDGIVDERGKSTVTVTVGAEGNNGAYAFGPSVVQVDPGTTVVWEWNVKGGSHNVVAKDGSYESELQGSDGDRFDRTFDVEGISKYYCGPHRAMGMKGAVVVGSPTGAEGAGGADGGSEDGWLYGLVGAFVTALLSPLLFFGLRSREDGAPEVGGRSHGPGQR